MSDTKNDQLFAMRHSLAHVMATAILKLWPDAKLGIGPVVDDGFYYDIEIDGLTILEEDLAKIEAEMKKVIAEDQKFVRSEKKLAEAMAWANENGQIYKQELLRDLKDHGTTIASELGKDELSTVVGDKIETVSFYTNGDFTDLCRGPHVESTGKVGAFKLVRLAGAYWRGKETNPQLQRIYGVAFNSQTELDDYLKMQEEAKARDHRELGPRLGLFMLHETSPGMPYWMPNGAILYNNLISYWRQEHAKRGYQEIFSPVINKRQLYETSGHFDHYWEHMFVSKTPDGGEYGVKAMNCPNAMIAYGFNQHSYKEFPLRYSDTDSLHRFEPSGTLHGLLRVRGFRQDDAHIFVSEDQIEEEYKRILEITETFYSLFGMEYSFRLGTRPEKFMGEAKTWDKAETILKDVLKKSGKTFSVLEGDGAFYGPKIDILMNDSLKREWQMGTIQLDFHQPESFGLVYTDIEGNAKTPIAIHRVIYGSLERFIGILIEHTAGRFPFWLAPEQVRILQINDKVGDYVAKIKAVLDEVVLDKPLRFNPLRVSVDERNESLGKKIHEAESMKVPLIIIVGDKDVSAKTVSLRFSNQEKTIQLDELKAWAEKFEG